MDHRTVDGGGQGVDGEVDVVPDVGVDGRRPHRLGVGPVLAHRRSVGAVAVHDDQCLGGRPHRRADGGQLLEGDGLALDGRRRPRTQRHLAPVAERGGGGQGHGDHHHPDVDDHAAVGPADEAPPGADAVPVGAPAGEDQLADVRGRGETTQAEGEEGADTPDPEDRRSPRPPATPTAAGTSSRSRSVPTVALRQGRAGPMAMSTSRASPMGRVRASK